MIATEAGYHRQCLSSYYNQERGLNKATEKSSEGILTGVALAELISRMEDQRVEGNKVVFKLSDLVFMYVNRLNELGVDQVGRVHSTQLKNIILAASSDFEAKNIGRGVYLTFKEEIGQILQNVYLEDDDEEGKYLAKAAKVVRRDMFEMTSNFDGTFSSGCQINVVPKTLVILMDVIMMDPI